MQTEKQQENGVNRRFFSAIKQPDPDKIVLTEPAEPAVELKDGKVVWRDQPERSWHLCMGCEHFVEPVKVVETPRPTGRTHVEYQGFCSLAGPSEGDLSSETVLKCNKFLPTWRVVAKKWALRGAIAAAAIYYAAAATAVISLLIERL